MVLQQSKKNNIGVLQSCSTVFNVGSSPQLKNPLASFLCPADKNKRQFSTESCRLFFYFSIFISVMRLFFLE